MLFFAIDAFTPFSKYKSRKMALLLTTGKAALASPHLRDCGALTTTQPTVLLL